MRIVLIEDDKGHEFLIKKSFKRVDGLFDLVKVYQSGEEALVDLKSQNASLILLDLNLPGMYGLDVLRSLKGDDSTKHIPVVILTTSNRASDVLEAYRNHVAGYIVKPITFDKFVEVASAILGFFKEAELPSAIT